MTFFDYDHWSEIYAALAKNKLRTALTAFGVFWGIFMLMLLLGSGNGLENGVSSGFAGSAANAVYMWTQRTTKPYRDLPPGRRFDFNNADEAARCMPSADTVCAKTTPSIDSTKRSSRKPSPVPSAPTTTVFGRASPAR